MRHDTDSTVPASQLNWAPYEVSQGVTGFKCKSATAEYAIYPNGHRWRIGRRIPGLFIGSFGTSYKTFEDAVSYIRGDK